MTLVAPSILAADLLHLQEQIKACEKGGADMLHVDVMDGNFVPNITMGPVIVSTLTSITDIEKDVHLMIEQPERYLDTFYQSGADILTVHQEAALHIDRTISRIKDLGIKAGVSLNPGTSLMTIEWLLSKLDLVLLMSVNPGFGGQKFIPYVLDKIKALKAMRAEKGAHFMIQVDGGINHENAAQLIDAGTDILVAGSSVFKSKYAIEDSIERLKKPLRGSF